MATCLRIKKLSLKTGICKTGIYNKLRPGGKYFDPTFPRPISIGLRGKAWIEEQVDAWIVRQAQLSLQEQK